MIVVSGESKVRVAVADGLRSPSKGIVFVPSSDIARSVCQLSDTSQMIRRIEVMVITLLDTRSEHTLSDPRTGGVPFLANLHLTPYEAMITGDDAIILFHDAHSTSPAVVGELAPERALIYCDQPIFGIPLDAEILGFWERQHIHTYGVGGGIACADGGVHRDEISVPLSPASFPRVAPGDDLAEIVDADAGIDGG